MYQKISFIMLSVICVLLTGCSMSKKIGDSITTDTGTVAPLLLTTPQIGIQSCDDYLSLVECLVKTNTSTGSNTYETLYKDFLSSRKDVPVSQLELTCQSLMDNLMANPDVLDQNNCRKVTSTPTTTGDENVIQDTGTVTQ